MGSKPFASPCVHIAKTFDSVYTHTMDQLSFATALTSNRLEDFIAQAEAAGIGPADSAAFDRLMGAVTAPLPEGRTSRSPAPDGSREK